MISLEEIKEKQEELNKMIEEYESQKDLMSTWDKNWKPKESEVCWFIDSEGKITYFGYLDCNYFDKLIKHNRIFQTEELAKKWLEIDTYLREKSFEPDWNDSNQVKYYLYYNFDTKKFGLNYVHTVYYFVSFYFESTEIKEEIFKKYTTEELKFYFNIGE